MGSVRVVRARARYRYRCRVSRVFVWNTSRSSNSDYFHLPFINNDDNIDNGNGLGLEGPCYVSECEKGLLAGGCLI